MNLVLLGHHRHVMSRRCFTGLSRVSLRIADDRLPLLARALTAQRSQTRRKHSSSGNNSSVNSGDHDARESTSPTSTSTSSAPADDTSVGPRSTKKTDLSGLKHQVEHRATETIGIRVTERVVERIAEAAELGAEKAAASRTVAAVVKRAGSRAATTTMRPAGAAAGAAPRGILGSLPVRMAVARVGRGFLIALPLAGAGFAAWIGRSDYRRTRQELELARARFALAEEKHNSEDMGSGRVTGGAVVSRPTLDTSTYRCFGVATAADSVNVVAHLVAVYGLYQGWAPEGIVNAESVGLVSAIVSTGGAVRGEYLAARLGSGYQHCAGDGIVAAGSFKGHAAGGGRRVDKTGRGSQ